MVFGSGGIGFGPRWTGGGADIRSGGSPAIVREDEGAVVVPVVGSA
jgi:hypothetical protein